MGIGNVIVNVVDVGQGQCSFAEIYDDGMAPQLLHTLLFDCGSDKRLTTDWETNLNYIVKTISHKVPSFDLVVLSHSDSDHINLLVRLLDKFVAAGVAPTIGRVCYGGDWDNYTKSAKNVLSMLVEKRWCAEENIFTLPPDFTGFKDGSFTQDSILWISPDSVVAVTAIVGCVINSFSSVEKSRSEAEGLNRVSLICALLYKTGESWENSIKYIFCGDATNLTMEYFDSKIGESFPSTNNVMLTLPHHGSRVTGLDLDVSTDMYNEVARSNVTDFSAYIRPKTVTISVYEKHNHPSFEMIYLFGKTVISSAIVEDPRFNEEKQHALTAMMDVQVSCKDSDAKVPMGFYFTFNTPSCVFSTWYACDGQSSFGYRLGWFAPITATAAPKITSALNSHASWVYTTNAKGYTCLAGKVNLMESSSFTNRIKWINPVFEVEAAPVYGTSKEGPDRNLPTKNESTFAPATGVNCRPAVLRRTIMADLRTFR